MHENYTPLLFEQRGTLGLLLWRFDFGFALEDQAEEPAQDQEDNNQRNGNGDQYRQDQQEEIDQEIHEALPEVDQVLNCIACCALRLPSADLNRLDGFRGNHVNCNG